MLHSTPILPLAALLAAVLATPCLGEGVPRVEFKRELPVSGRYLLIPVANNQQNRSRITVTVDGRLVHRLECDFPSDRDSIAWWTYLEMGDSTGKTATITGNVDLLNTSGWQTCEMKSIRKKQP